MRGERGVLCVLNVHSARETIAELLMLVYWCGDVLLLAVEIQVALIGHNYFFKFKASQQVEYKRIICGDIMDIIFTQLTRDVDTDRVIHSRFIV